MTLNFKYTETKILLNMPSKMQQQLKSLAKHSDNIYGDKVTVSTIIRIAINREIKRAEGLEMEEIEKMTDFYRTKKIATHKVKALISGRESINKSFIYLEILSGFGLGRRFVDILLEELESEFYIQIKGNQIINLNWEEPEPITKQEKEPEEKEPEKLVDLDEAIDKL